MKKILILGANGMLGYAAMKFFLSLEKYEVFGTVRAGNSSAFGKHIFTGIDVENTDLLMSLFSKNRPDIVINCIGVIKQSLVSEDPLISLPINSVFPHRVAKICELSGARFIHISTDCVFSGGTGNYKESDTPDATDLYGISKYLGEVSDQNSITLRTSIIGHEINTTRSLISWFLSQHGTIKGYKNAIYSGLPTNELLEVMENYVFPNPDLTGLFHVSSKYIDKFQLLSIVKEVYEKQIAIEPYEFFVIDRSLNSEKFQKATGYEPKDWNDLICSMRNFYI